jgi:hypothetical protein
MAADIILYETVTGLPKQPLREALDAAKMVREGRERLRRARDAMIRYRDGDGSAAAHYDQLQAAVNFQAGDYADANAAAKMSFDELDSLTFKLTTNASVGDVLTALDQYLAKHGV